MKSISETIVMDYYLELMKANKIKFLVGKKEEKKKLRKLINQLKKTEDIHDKILVAKQLWMLLFDTSMTFIDPDKKGYDVLFKYFKEFVEFEELIFASDSFYRDHTLHCLWVYFLGEYLFNNEEFSFLFKNFNREFKRSAKVNEFFKQLDKPDIFGDFCNLLNNVTKVLQHDDSIRCVTALTHDLGYPLKKIAKINKSIGKILPYFSISNFGEFSFQYENVQQFYIENLLELLSCDIDFVIEIGNITYDEQALISESSAMLGHITNELNNFRTPDQKVVDDFTNYLENINEKESYIWRNIFAGTTRLTKSISRLMRFAHDFEEYQHGIMSSYLLMKILNTFSNIQLSYSDPATLSIEGIDISKIYSKLKILVAIADHTSPGYQFNDFSTYSALLVVVDEIEEFSRISRANQYRQFINEFCKTEMGMKGGCFCIDFIFDDASVVGLNPEITFKDKAKKFYKLFNIPELSEEIKIKFRCIGKLPDNKNIYEFNIARNHFSININGEEVDSKSYLKTKEIL